VSATRLNPPAKTVLEMAAAQAAGYDHIGTEHILLGLIRDDDDLGAMVLSTLGPDQNRVHLRVIQLLHARYATLRNTIESLNGLVKDPACEALAQPARRRVRGIAAQSIFTALLLMAANIRKIRA
jgi:ATP-dependent Clp protease ATP-binding subunit ClpA